MPRWRSTSPRPTEEAPGGVTGPPPLPLDAGPVLLGLARRAIAAHVGITGGDAHVGITGGDALVADAWLDTHDVHAWLDAPGACFVTLTAGGRLRGCIGSLEARRSLRADVTTNAVAAATRDRRFPPVAAADLPALAIEVSVLSPPQPFPVAGEADACARLLPGVDGVVLELRGRRATFLPQVWETLPDPRDFLAHLKTKAGLPADYWDAALTLSRYRVTEFHETAPHATGPHATGPDATHQDRLR